MRALQVVIVGAGPYGLSLAAHLAARGVEFRIFGPPMQVWREHMPVGMRLKSDGFASDLYDLKREFTLRRYCAERGLDYADYGLPVRLDTFVEYGLAFQRRLVPQLTEAPVETICPAPGGFRVRAANGDEVETRAVVLATGIAGYAFVPAPLDALPAELCTHSYHCHDLSRFEGRRVVVVGAGASATDLAALLRERGTKVELVTRHRIEDHLPPSPDPPSRWSRLRHPNLGLGPSWRSAIYTAVPGLFRHVPRARRLRIVAGHLGPAGAWFVRDAIEGKVPTHVGFRVEAAPRDAASVQLRCRSDEGAAIELRADHVIAATGYRVAVDRLPMLDPSLRTSVRTEAGSPVLSSDFESSVRGLHFVGVSSAVSFGPVMRFARGAEHTARRLSRLYAR